jgi:hypothetical protein
MTAILLGGFFAGALHVFGGPDHLAALAPLSVQARRRAWTLGLRWGLGHSAGVLLVAGFVLGLRQVLDLEALAAWSERLVGASLILLGLLGFRGLLRERLHAHVHDHGGAAHAHFHVHAPGEDHGHPRAHLHGHAALGVGLLHGLGGTAHLLGVLPGLAMPTGLQTLSYLGCFAAGTLAAMTSFAALIGVFSPSGTDRGLRTYRWMLGTASVACAVTGLAWLILPALGVSLA